MYYIKDILENEIIIQKSQFITHIFPVNSIDDVNLILANTKKKYYDATHNCFAYIIGDNMEIQKASDDGEPQKTAGAPMLEVLKTNQITNVLAIVTRYFGGILLGAGGLVRAYSKSVADAISMVKLYIKKSQIKFKLNLSYSGYNEFIKIKEINIVEQSFLDNVIVVSTCDIDLFNNIEELLYSKKISFNEIIKIGIEDILIEQKA